MFILDPLPNNFSNIYVARSFAAQSISTTFNDTKVNNCLSLYHTNAEKKIVSFF